MEHIYFNRIGQIVLSTDSIKMNPIFIDYFIRNNKHNNPIIISRKSVEDLIKVCDEILRYHKTCPTDNSKSENLLPASGIYDDEYYKCINDMKKFLQKKLIRRFDELECDNEFIEMCY